MDRIILATLQNASKDAVAGSIAPSLPIKFVDVFFDVPNDQKYLEIVWIPNNRENGYWGDEQDYQGLYRHILHWPLDSTGAYGPMDVALSIANYFTKERDLGGVKLTNRMILTGAIVEGPERLYPASARYTRFAADA